MKAPDPIAQRGQAGLCASCIWARIVTNDRGSVFFLCGMSKHDSTFRKYPRLPVIECRAFGAIPENDVPRDETLQDESAGGEISEGESPPDDGLQHPIPLELQGADQTMSEPFLVTKSRVVKVQGLERRGTLFDGTELIFGIHGPVKAYYKLEGQPDLPLPVDYLVTAAGG